MVSLFESEKSTGTDTSVNTHYMQEYMVMAPYYTLSWTCRLFY